MVKKTFSLLAVLWLVACTPHVDDVHLARMNGMVGMAEQQLIDNWGVPSRSYVMEDKTKVVTYTRQNEYTSGGFGGSACIGAVPGSIGYGTCFGGPGGRLQRYYCDLSFKIKAGRIASWAQQGNDCPRITP